METKSHNVVLTCFQSWKRPNKSVYRIAITRLLLRCYKLEVGLGHSSEIEAVLRFLSNFTGWLFML